MEWGVKVKSLMINPHSYEIKLGSDMSDSEEGISTINYTFGDDSGSYCITALEAQKIGNWFLALSKELKPKPKKKKASKG